MPYALAKLSNRIPVSFWDGERFQPFASSALVYDSPPEFGGDGVVLLIFTGGLRQAMGRGEIVQK